jgi:hypothetical protein
LKVWNLLVSLLYLSFSLLICFLFIYHTGQIILTKWWFLRFLFRVNTLTEYFLSIILEAFPVAKINSTSLGNFNSGMAISLCWSVSFMYTIILFVSYIGLYFRE